MSDTVDRIIKGLNFIYRHFAKLYAGYPLPYEFEDLMKELDNKIKITEELMRKHVMIYGNKHYFLEGHNLADQADEIRINTLIIEKEYFFLERNKRDLDRIGRSNKAILNNILQQNIRHIKKYVNQIRIFLDAVKEYMEQLREKLKEEDEFHWNKRKLSVKIGNRGVPTDPNEITRYKDQLISNFKSGKLLEPYSFMRIKRHKFKERERALLNGKN